MSAPGQGATKLPEVFDDRCPYVTPEHRLMMAVITEALNDAVGVPVGCVKLSERELAKRRAIAWFEGNSRDFQVICLAAGLEPSQVRARALVFIASSSRMPRRYTSSFGHHTVLSI